MAGARRARSGEALLLASLSCLLLLSGAAGLMYQVAWVRLLGLTFGVTVHAISTVLAAFMAGLAVGSLAGGAMADRLRRPLRAYGYVELGIGATALLTAPALERLQDVYVLLAQVADPQQAPLLAASVRASLAFAVLLVPTALMGASLPLAVRGLRGALAVGDAHVVRADSRAMGVLYAVNTTGAILGCLAAGFGLIGWVGLSGTLAAAALANALAGLGALAVSRAVAADRGAAGKGLPTGEPVADSSSRGPQSSILSPQHSRRLARAAFWAFGLSGAVSLAYEVVWSRLLSVLFDQSIYGFVLMLATVLFGIALGSAVAGALVTWRPGARTAGVAFGWLEIGIGVAAAGSLVAFGGAYDLVAHLRDSGGPLIARLLRTEVRFMAALSVVTVLPAALLIGATFPVAARLWAAGQDRLGARLGGVYAVNVAGAIAGSLAGGFVLVPLLGAHGALLLLAASNVALGAWLLFVADGRRLLLPLLGGSFGLAAVLWGALQPTVHVQAFRQRFPDQELLWFREGLENTVSVARQQDGTLRLYTNSYSQTTDHPDLVIYHRVMGHLAALLAPTGPDGVRRVLVVGVGGGATPGAIAQHSDTHVDLVELSGAVVEAVPWFRHANHDLLRLPNVSLAIDDGRNWLLRSRDRYQIITADIVPPTHAGANNLYSVEYFRLAAENLAPGGIMVQWVAAENAAVHELVVRTFLAAFPHATLWLSGDLLVGSLEPLRVDPAELERRLADPAVRASLAAVGLNTPRDVLFHFRGDTTELRRYAGDGPVLSDDRPMLEYFRSRAVEMEVAPADLSGFSGDERTILAR